MATDKVTKEEVVEVLDHGLKLTGLDKEIKGDRKNALVERIQRLYEVKSIVKHIPDEPFK